MQRCPDWIIEIVSPSSSPMDYYTKLSLYRSAGVREYWIVDPMKHTILVYDMEHDSAPTVFSFSDIVKVNIYDNLYINFSELDLGIWQGFRNIWNNSCICRLYLLFDYCLCKLVPIWWRQICLNWFYNKCSNSCKGLSWHKNCRTEFIFYLAARFLQHLRKQYSLQIKKHLRTTFIFCIMFLFFVVCRCYFVV